MPDYSLIAIASLVLLCAHGMRVGRWSLLFPDSGIMPRFSYLFGLSAGYAVNAFVPFRLGEVLRIWIVVHGEKQRFSLVAATVVLERLTDLLAVSLIFAAIVLLEGPAAFPDGARLALGMAGLAGAGLGLGVAIGRSLWARRLLWAFAGIFNSRISLALADFFWVFSELVLSRVAARWPYLGMSLAMWGFYLASYWLFAAGFGISPGQAAFDMLGHPAAAMMSGIGAAGDAQTGPGMAPLLAAYTLAPLAAVLGFGLLRAHRMVRRLLGQLRRFGRLGANPFAGEDRFTTAETYNRFLTDLFRGEDRLATSFWREALADCVMHRFFNGGSDAITALVEVEGRLLIRKFAIGGAAVKLAEQTDWLRREAASDLPLVSIAAEHRAPEFYSYDMPLVTPANDFYDVIHTLESAQTERIFLSVLDHIDRFHARTRAPQASAAVVAEYLRAKAQDNARTILAFVAQQGLGPGIEINGRRVDLADLARLTDPDWLEAQVTTRAVATVHGDLTIENIIVAPQSADGFYLIDPNPENIFNAPLIDWAKLMQSLHLGYEALNRGMTCRVEGDAITLHVSRSQAYSRLHERLEAEIIRRHGAEALREVYFHEIVHYLRLTTYKIRQDRLRGIGFFACTCLLLEEYLARWERKP